MFVLPEPAAPKIQGIIEDIIIDSRLEWKKEFRFCKVTIYSYQVHTLFTCIFYTIYIEIQKNNLA